MYWGPGGKEKKWQEQLGSSHSRQVIMTAWYTMKGEDLQVDWKYILDVESIGLSE